MSLSSVSTYNRLLAGLPSIERPRELARVGSSVPSGLPSADTSPVHSVYHQYTIQVDNRDAVMARLAAEGVQSMVYYPVPLHLQEVHASLGRQAGSLPRAEAAARSCLSLPMFPELNEKQQVQVTRALTLALAEQPSSSTLRMAS